MLHHYLRKILPFIYVRNWYSGQFELSFVRAGIAFCIFIALVIAVIIILTMSQPIEYRT
jgi:ABC-type transport system involved in cytochrome bd biosynthesis fused ATPase/permease subunit